MALALSTGTAQSTTGASLTPLFRPASYVASREAPGETVYANTNAAIDQPNNIRLAVSTVADLFKGTNIPYRADAQLPSGLSMLAQVTETWKIDDAADALASIYFPASAHIVIRVPSHELVTSTEVANLVRRLLGVVLLDADDTLAQGWNNPLHQITKF